MSRTSKLYGGIFLLIVLSALLLYLLWAVAVPFLLALLLAYFLNPAADALEKRGVSRSGAVCLVFAGFILAAGLLLAFVVPAVKKEVTVAQEALPRHAEALYRMVPDTAFEAVGIENREDLQEILARALVVVRSLSFDVVNQLAVFLSRAFTSTLGFLIAILGYLIIPVYLFYLLRDFGSLRRGVLNLLPERHHSAVLEVGGEIDKVWSAFIRGQLTVCLILAALYSVGLAVIGIDLALVVGIIAGLAFIIPYVGTIFGITAGVLLAAVEFKDLLHPALVVGWFVLVQVLESLVITPKIVGDRVGLTPLATILAVLIGGELFGFLGLLLAVPVAAAGRVIFDHSLQHYRRSGFYRRAA